MPKPIRHGLADAVQRLYDERALAAYDTVAAKIRFRAVIDFAHPRPASGRQRDLFAYAAARRRPDAAIPASLALLRARADLYMLTPEQRSEILQAPDLPAVFAAAGMTPDLLDGWLLGENDPRAWAAVLPSMSYADSLSRLRGLGECGLSREAVQKLADPARIAAERVRPLRLYEAARQRPTWFSSAPSTAASPSPRRSRCRRSWSDGVDDAVCQLLDEGIVRIEVVGLVVVEEDLSQGRVGVDPRRCRAV